MPDQAPSHGYSMNLLTVAGELTKWQRAALTLPLAEVRATSQESIAHLGCVLNDFNNVYRQRDTASDEDMALAIGRAVRQAGKAAIYALAAMQRTAESATAN
jgi:hypothetical protein